MNLRKTIKVWVSKGALTQGVRQVQVRVVDNNIVEYVDGLHYSMYLSKGDWWHTKEQALKKAESMRKAKIASLKKELRALEKMSFV
jgi:hypothetical protein